MGYMAGMPGMDHSVAAADPHTGGTSQLPDPHEGRGTAAQQPLPVEPWVQVSPLVSVRGVVKLPSAGSWAARINVGGPSGESYSAETILDAANGEPNRVYLLLTGTIIVTALASGVAARWRAAHATAKG